jgi:hypothetical protein
VESTVSILTSAFTAIGTMTTAYFGIRAVSNTAQHWTVGPRGSQAGTNPTTGSATDAQTPETEQQG